MERLESLFFVLLSAITPVALLCLWRNTRPGSRIFVVCLWGSPFLGFVIGAIWLAWQGWNRATTIPTGGYSPVGVAIMVGTFWAMWVLATLFYVGVGLLILRAIAPITFARLIRRVR